MQKGGGVAGGYKLIVRRTRVGEQKGVFGWAEHGELFSSQIFSCGTNIR